MPASRPQLPRQQPLPTQESTECKRFITIPSSSWLDTVDGDLLKIKGEREQGAAEGTEPLRAERASGPFERHFRLRESAAADGVEAKYRHGVLTVSIPKLKAREPYRIEVTAN
jgi:hypothetical protein